jgi:hypothetical protein
MTIGRKTGGRMAGTPNRKTADLLERLDSLGVDPVSGLAAIAKDEAAPIELRARVQMELMTYIYPKRKSLDLSTTENQSINIQIGIPLPAKPVVAELEGFPHRAT